MKENKLIKLGIGLVIIAFIWVSFLIEKPNDLPTDRQPPFGASEPYCTTGDWTEILVKVGGNGIEKGTTRDGDIVAVKDAGWCWGLEERRKFVVIRVPTLTKIEIADLLIGGDKDYVPTLMREIDEFTTDSLKSIKRHGIDYTSLVNLTILKDIRNPKTENPIIDLREEYKTKEIKDSVDPLVREKTDITDSIVPVDKRLTYKQSWLSKFNPIRKAKALSTITKTIANGGGNNCPSSTSTACDYSTLQLWEDGEDGNLVSLDEIHKGVAYEDGGNFTENVVFDGSTTDATRYMWLTVADGDKHNGIIGGGVVNDPTSDGHAFNIVDDNILLEWFEVTGLQTDSDEGVRVNGDNATIRYFLIHDLNITDQDGIYQANTSFDVTVENSIIFDVDRACVHAQNFSGSVTQNWTLDNITAFACNSGDTGEGNIHIRTSSGSTITITSTNVISMDTGFGVDDWQNEGAGTEIHNGNYNMGSDTTTPGANSLDSKISSNQFVSLTGGSQDLHLKSGSDAIDVGTDNGITDDIDGDSRPQNSVFDIGADEVTVAADSAPDGFKIIFF